MRGKKTPRAGFEPATNRLTVDRSTAELPRIELQEPTLLTYLAASRFNRSVRLWPFWIGPKLPCSIFIAPSQYSSSSKR